MVRPENGGKCFWKDGWGGANSKFKIQNSKFKSNCSGLLVAFCTRIASAISVSAVLTKIAGYKTARLKIVVARHDTG
jgi:hypothetical protein